MIAVNEATTYREGRGNNPGYSQCPQGGHCADDIDDGIQGTDFMKMDFFWSNAMDLRFCLRQQGEDLCRPCRNLLNQIAAGEELKDFRQGTQFLTAGTVDADSAGGDTGELGLLDGEDQAGKGELLEFATDFLLSAAME
jgi:hypothetical protein